MVRVGGGSRRLFCTHDVHKRYNVTSSGTFYVLYHTKERHVRQRGIEALPKLPEKFDELEINQRMDHGASGHNPSWLFISFFTKFGVSHHHAGLQTRVAAALARDFAPSSLPVLRNRVTFMEICGGLDNGESFSKSALMIDAGRTRI